MVLYVVFVVAIAILAVGFILARRIEKRIEPPARPGHGEDRFHFKYGAEPPGNHGGRILPP